MFRKYLFGVVLGITLTALFISQLAQAKIEERIEPAVAAERNENPLISISGKLICPSLAPATESQCLISIVENSTGRTLRLTGTDSAVARTRELFLAGTRVMTLQGALQDENTLEILGHSR